jgi:PBP1b-binding outer membrane lipoprotein LpoB
MGSLLTASLASMLMMGVILSGCASGKNGPPKSAVTTAPINTTASGEYPEQAAAWLFPIA